MNFNQSSNALSTIIRTSMLALSTMFCFNINTISAMDVPIDDFSITAYSQNANDYISNKSDNYTKSSLSPNYQHAQFLRFYNHYFDTTEKGMSPWSETMVNSFLPLIPKIVFKILDDFNNEGKPVEKKHYGENFKAHDSKWWGALNNNVDWLSLDTLNFKTENRAIAVANTYARALPDMAPDFYHATLPGQGFPFDNLQESAIWAGTPLYVLSASLDRAWTLVLTPDAYFAWVKASDIAVVSPEFIAKWQQAAKKKLLAITKTDISIVDKEQQFQFKGYIGAIFPSANQDAPIQGQMAILIPVKGTNNSAIIKTAFISTEAIKTMPLLASPQNMVSILNQLKNRPYGWGGAYFFNDCSQEMKSIFTPFGIWLPRNSFQQSLIGKSLDLSASKLEERLDILKEKGHPLMTIVYVGGHVFLYVGNAVAQDKDALISYQSTWGMHSKKEDRRYVIGQSLFIPLLKSYEEQPNARPYADGKYFKLIYLDALPENDSPNALINRYLK